MIRSPHMILVSRPFETPWMELKVLWGFTSTLVINSSNEDCDLIWGPRLDSHVCYYNFDAHNVTLHFIVIAIYFEVSRMFCFCGFT